MKIIFQLENFQNVMKSILYLIGLILLISCKGTDKQNVATEVVFTKFPDSIDLTFSKLFKVEGGLPRKLYVTDSNLIVKVSDAKNYNFYKYSLKTYSKQDSFFNLGRGEGQVLGPMSSGVFDGKLWIHDITLDKLQLLI